jgi:hypothetical protein
MPLKRSQNEQSPPSTFSDCFAFFFFSFLLCFILFLKKFNLQFVFFLNFIIFSKFFKLIS